MGTKNPRVIEALLPLKAQLEAEREAILERVRPLHEQRAALLAEIHAKEAALRPIEAAIDALEIPRLRELGNELAAIARQIAPTVVTLQNEGEAASGGN